MTFFTQADLGKNKKWSWFILGFIVIFVAYFIGQTPLIVVAQSLVSSGSISADEAEAFYRTLDFNSVGISSTLGLLLLLCSFIAALLVLYLYVVYVHGRKFASLVSSRPVHWDKIMLAFIVWFILTIASEAVMYLKDPGSYQVTFEMGAWLPLMLVVLVMLPLQTSFEEIFVRGYLMQRIGLSVNRPWIAVLLTSLFFGLMHGSNPEIKEFGLGIMMAYYISVGAFLAILTVLDDGLEYALGIHAATNIYGGGIVTYKGSAIQTDALFRVDVIDPLWVLLLSYISMLIFYLLVHRKYGLAGFIMLFQPIRKSIDTVVQEISAPDNSTQFSG